MKIISYGDYKTLPSGKKKVRAFIVSDTMPDGFPASAAAVNAAFQNHEFDTMSVMYVMDNTETDQVFVVKEDGTWTASNAFSLDSLLRASGVKF